MKTIHKLVLAFTLCLSTSLGAKAQYYQIADQLQNMLSAIFTGGSSYKGFVDASYMRSIGNNRVDFAEITTTHGCSMASWFFMGAGLGVEAMMARNDGVTFEERWQATNSYRSTVETIWTMPVYIDFHITIGGTENVGMFADFRVGSAFKLSDKALAVSDGYISTNEFVYLRPSVGMRIPIGEKSAVNIGLSYKLLMSNYWYEDYSDITLHALGLNVGLEW